MSAAPHGYAGQLRRHHRRKREGEPQPAFWNSCDRMRDEPSTIERCLFCPWTFKGTALEGRLAFMAHRAHAHASGGDVDTNGDIVGRRRRFRDQIEPAERSVDVGVDDQADLVLGLLAEARRARGAVA